MKHCFSKVPRKPSVCQYVWRFAPNVSYNYILKVTASTYSTNHPGQIGLVHMCSREEQIKQTEKLLKVHVHVDTCMKPNEIFALTFHI